MCAAMSAWRAFFSSASRSGTMGQRLSFLSEAFGYIGEAIRERERIVETASLHGFNSMAANRDLERPNGGPGSTGIHQHWSLKRASVEGHITHYQWVSCRKYSPKDQDAP
jgi:hypothetical protein